MVNTPRTLNLGTVNPKSNCMQSNSEKFSNNKNAVMMCAINLGLIKTRWNSEEISTTHETMDRGYDRATAWG